MNNPTLRWHPRYSKFQLSQGALFLSETDDFFVKKSEFDNLNAFIMNHGKLSDYIFQSTETMQQISRLKRIDELVENRILTKEKADALDYVTDDYYSINTRLHIRNNIYVLSESIKNNQDQLNEVINSLTDLDSQIIWVVVDDFFDPNLIEINKYSINKNQDWCLVKLSGDEPILGPLFRSKNKSKNIPCFECLRSRIIQNKPVREWYRRYMNQHFHIALPCRSDFSNLVDRLDALRDHFYTKLKASDKSIFFQLVKKEWKEHSVTKRPQCATCGDPNYFFKINQEPITLESIDKNLDLDGGFRQLSRFETYSKLKGLVDSTAGVISDIQEISQLEDENRLKIYRASYFQNSYSLDDPSADTFVQLSLGKGVSDEQALVSALGEALERQAAQYTGDENILISKPGDLDNRYFLPQELTPFSNSQYKIFEKYSSVSLEQPQWVKQYDGWSPISWIRGWSISKHEFVYFPAPYCLANTPFSDHVYSLYNHNGNSAGNTKEEAILQGALELIERDAAALWWYNQIPRKEIDISIIPEKQLSKIDNTLAEQWEYWLLDISSDINVACSVAVGQHKYSKNFVLGFGAHIDPRVACTRSLTEMFQLIVVRDKVTGPFDFGAIEPLPYLFPKRNTNKLAMDAFPIIKNQSLRDDILYIEEDLKEKNLELCVVDYTRPDINLKTLKVIVPGLCHFWPQFANERLFSIPVKQGWLTQSLNENELNPIPLYL